MRELTDSGCPWVGKIPENWTVKKVKFLIESGENGMKIGPYGSALKGKTLSDGPVKIYNQANLIADDFDFARHFISEESYKELQNYTINAGDILFSMMGTIGKCKIMPDNKPLGIMDSHLLKARLTEEVLPRFFLYAFDKDLNPITLEQLIFKSNGSIMNGLNSTVVKTTELAIPTLPEQHAIVAYLDEKCAAIDESIQKRKEIIEKLQEYRKAVITQAVTKGLNSSLKDTGGYDEIHWFGNVPNGWKISKLKHEVILRRAKATDKSNYIGLENIESFTGRRVGEQLDPEGEAIVFKKGDVLFGKLRPYLSKSLSVNEDGCCSGEILVMKPKQIDQSYLLYITLSETFVKRVDISTYGTKMPRANWEFIGNMLIPVPPLSEQRKIAAHLDEKCLNIDTMLSKQQTIIDKLEEYKKSIIYNAVTGKIDCRPS